MNLLRQSGLLATLVLVGASLVSCAESGPIPTTSPLPTNTVQPGPRLHASGPKTMWLNDEYADGLGDEWNPGGELCYVDADLDIALIQRPGEVLAMKVGGSSALWTRAGEDCRKLQVSPDTSDSGFFVAPLPEERHEDGEQSESWAIASLLSGRDLTTVTESRPGWSEMLAPDEDGLYYQHTDYLDNSDESVDDVTALAWDGTVRWRTTLKDAGLCRRVSTVVACATTRLVSIIDTQTGALLSELPGVSIGEIEWLSDGYYIDGLSAVIVRGFDGTKIGEVSSDPFLSLALPNALFSAEDVLGGAHAPVTAGNGDQPFVSADNRVSVLTPYGQREVFIVRLSVNGHTAFAYDTSGNWWLIDVDLLTTINDAPLVGQVSLSWGYIQSGYGLILPAGTW